MTQRITLLAFLLGIFAMSVLSSCSHAPAAVPQMPPTSVQTQTISLSDIKEQSDYQATLKSRKSVTLHPNVEGYITLIRVHSGQLVKAGEKIIQIDSRMQTAQTAASAEGADSIKSDLASSEATLASFESTLKSKYANLEYTKSQFQRYNNLQKEGAISLSDLDARKNSYIAAQADVDATIQQIQAQKMVVEKYKRTYKQALSSLKMETEHLKYFEIKAPFTGIIGDIPAKVGDHVTTDTELTKLTENHPLELYVAIPAEMASQLEMGDKISLTSSSGTAYGDSTVIFIAPTVDSESQTVLVKALFDNAKSTLRADQQVTARIVWDAHPGILVPTKAVSQVAGKSFVFIVGENSKGQSVAKQAEIEVAGIEGNSYQVKSGLKAGDKLITTGIQRLADGAPVALEPKMSASSNVR